MVFQLCKNKAWNVVKNSHKNEYIDGGKFKINSDHL